MSRKLEEKIAIIEKNGGAVAIDYSMNPTPAIIADIFGIKIEYSCGKCGSDQVARHVPAKNYPVLTCKHCNANNVIPLKLEMGLLL